MSRTENGPIQIYKVTSTDGNARIKNEAFPWAWKDLIKMKKQERASQYCTFLSMWTKMNIK